MIHCSQNHPRPQGQASRWLESQAPPSLLWHSPLPPFEPSCGSAPRLSAGAAPAGLRGCPRAPARRGRTLRCRSQQAFLGLLFQEWPLSLWRESRSPWWVGKGRLWEPEYRNRGSLRSSQVTPTPARRSGGLIRTAQIPPPLALGDPAFPQLSFVGRVASRLLWALEFGNGQGRGNKGVNSPWGPRGSQPPPLTPAPFL